MSSWNEKLLAVLEKSFIEDMDKLSERDTQAAVNYGKRLVVYKKSLMTIRQLSEIGANKKPIVLAHLSAHLKNIR